MLSCNSRSRNRASRRSRRVSPMPIRMPDVNGMASSPAARMTARRAEGSLSGEPKCGPPRAPRRAAAVSSIRPWETDDAAQCGELRRSHNAGIEVWQQARSFNDQGRHGREIGDRRVVPERRQLLARDAIALFRFVAEREQRLAASGRGAGARDGKHFVGAQIGAPATRGGWAKVQ